MTETRIDRERLKMILGASTTLSIATFPSPYLWDMKRLSPLFHPPQQPDKPSFAADNNPDDDDEHIILEQIHQHKEPQLPEEENIAKSCEWDFSLSTVVSSTGAPTASTSDTLGVIEFDPSGAVMATAGMGKKIRAYRWDSLLQSPPSADHSRVCDYYICTPAKLSSLRWKLGSSGGIIGAGDYDGVVTEYDLERRVPTFERDEHGGRRVWSVDYSRRDPAVGASGSDDGTVQVWDSRCEAGSCVAALRHRGPVCSVEFNPFGGAMTMAVGCADRKAYGYDVRRLVDPVQVFEGHSKTVTYVRFLDVQTVVSASTDGCLKQWNVEDGRVVRTYRGHVNSRSFVGLSVLSHGGLLGCGSESDQVFVYDKRWEEPIWVGGGGGGGAAAGRFISSVGWRQVGEEQCTLVAGGSDGVLQVYEGKRITPPLISSSSNSSSEKLVEKEIYDRDSVDVVM